MVCVECAATTSDSVSGLEVVSHVVVFELFTLCTKAEFCSRSQMVPIWSQSIRFRRFPSSKECEKWFARRPGACLSDLPGPPQLVPQSEAALVGVFEPQVEDIDIFDALRKLPRLGRGHDRRGVAGWRS